MADIATIRIAMDHIGRGVQMVDETGRIVVANALAAEMLGVSPSFLAGKPLVSEVIAEQCRRAEFQACSRELRREISTHVGDDQPFRFRRLRPNGRVIEVENVPLAEGGFVRTHTDVTDRHEAEQRIAFLAHNDFLTGLANRASFQKALTDAVQDNGGFALVLIDLDGFKQVNDTLGHQFGDALLREVAARIRVQTRGDDLVARIGGDELALLVAPLPDPAAAQAIAAQIVEAMRQPVEHAGQACIPSVSVGVACVPPGPVKPAGAELAQRQADIALYSAKTAGRGCWRAFDSSMASRETQERQLLVELRAALDDDEFEVHYQPIIDLASNAISGFEALLRWYHPSRGLLAAGEFIPFAERSGLILPIGLWVLGRACHDALAWPEEVRLLVNLSPSQLGSTDALEVVRTALNDSGLSPRRLELEITESSIIQSVEVAEHTLCALRDLGVRVALDDFGTGYSSLSHIRMLRFDTIKIDRSFVSDAASRADCGAIVRAVASLASELGASTIAEGVETEGQLDWIRRAGCNEAQGYLFSKPVSALQAVRLLCEPTWVGAAAARTLHPSPP